MRKERKREVKAMLYESNEIKHEEIINKIMNKSHLKFVVDYESHRNEKYQIYVEEKISCYDNYITHLNTNSYIIFGFNNYSEVHYTSNGILIGTVNYKETNYANHCALGKRREFH